MDNTIEIDMGQAARELGLPLDSVQNTVELLDDGNTVPFITRFRKDRTGALDEEQVRRIQEKVGKLRALADRKRTVLKSIQSQGVLTAELAEQIRTAPSSKRLEDLYLPYKPKKQTLATTARQRGLEPLAREVLDADPAAADLAARAASFIAPEQELLSVDEVLSGVRHILAEWFSERADVRGRLRKILQRTAKLVCTRVETAARRDVAPAAAAPPAADSSSHDAPESGSSESASSASPDAAEQPAASLAEPSPPSPSAPTDAACATVDVPVDATVDAPVDDVPADAAPAAVEVKPAALPDPETPPPPSAGIEPAAAPVPPADVPPADDAASAGAEPDAAQRAEGEAEPGTPPDVEQRAEVEPGAGPSVTAAEAEPAGVRPESGADTSVPVRPRGALSKLVAKRRGALAAAMSKKEKKRQRLEAAFKDYFAFEELISRIPPHRVLAINRGERARILRVKMEGDLEAMAAEADTLLIPSEHVHAEFLRSCVRDALTRLLIPSLERELRREMAEAAEVHAVEVFARNLRKLLLQPPVHNHRVLAIDPGFRSGCKLIALDEFGNVLGHEIIHVIGKEEWIQAGRAKLLDLVRRHRLSVVAIGNGAGCRETELLIVDVLGKELKDEEMAFVIVNEAGASVYSTSPVGREELPQYDAVLRSAISIGRRLLDPLSELVKINPANIGVGMYQHDVKAKHLRNSLDAVVESCVNYVGVDVNTASPALLRYVSGMNQLTARRLCEYRAKHGPFRTREELKQVSGFGDATFVQAAGFLKITNGDNPLDATWIHPESYDLARQVLAKAGCSVGDLVAGPAETPADNVLAPTTTDDPIIAPPAPTAQPAIAEPVVSELATAETEAAEPVAAEAEAAEPVAAETEAAEPVASEPAGESAFAAAASVARGGGEPEPVRLVQERVRGLDVQALASEMSVSELLLRDILNSLARPGRDPREDLPAPVFRRGIVKLEDLEPGMKLAGTVLNVVDFGAFVDIGLPDSGLVHISRLADRFVRDPHAVVGVGDVLTVWVVDVDKQRRRVSLTAIEPGTEKPAETRHESARPRARKPAGGKRPGGRPPKPVAAGASRTDGGGRRPKSPQRPRPPQKPKIVRPITKEMEEGKEPLRSFSDLMQFYQKKQSDGK